MKLDLAFLKLLACPLCRGTLRWDETAAELVCEACARAYPVRDGIPDLLPESGRSLHEKA